MSKQLPPGPRTPALIQLLRFATNPFDFFDACARTHGDPFTVDMATFGKFVMVSAPDLIKQIFAGNDDTLYAGKANRDLEPFVGMRSLLLLDGDAHLRHRRLLLPPFHGERMKVYATLMWEGAKRAVAEMPEGAPFAIHPFMQRVTLEIILRAVFGLTKGPQMERMFHALVEYLEPPSPVLMFLPQVDLPLTPYRSFLRRRNVVDREIYAILAERKSKPEETANSTDILSLLLSARDERGEPLSDGELRDELMTLLIAGHETTATSLSWAFERLLSEKEVLERLIAELGASSISAEAIAGCEYLDAVVRESLRVRPILPDVVREVQAPWKLGEWELPAGTRVAPCIHLAHNREDNWPEPKKFRPERFLGTKVNPYAWFPFGGGIRRCLGMAFALYEMKIVLGAVLIHARLRLASSAPVKPVRRGVTMAPEGGTRVVLTERMAR